MFVPLHHDGGGSGFDWVTVLYVLLALGVLAGIGFGIWWLVQRRRYG